MMTLDFWKALSTFSSINKWWKPFQYWGFSRSTGFKHSDSNYVVDFDQASNNLIQNGQSGSPYDSVNEDFVER